MIGILAGSSRQGSNTAKVAMAIRIACLDAGIPESEIRLPDFNKFDLPFQNAGSVTKNHLSVFQKEVYETMRESQLLFILSPEYNWFPSAEIINLINQYGTSEFRDCWEGKVFATCGVSSGRGGRIPAVQLTYVINKLINAMDLHSVVSPKVFESQFTGKVIDANGVSLGNQEYNAGLQKFVSYNLELLQKIQPGLNP